ncbi:GNAT family N-acetyltransferase [Hymenobacter sp. 15J16-1T3B]|uniref:GNAT family N-acetyltransferase n=1 Tax=Hymenobacter sp. 15J16-1T3B TaxID=2886941 RepID=UPI001D12B2C0|nr:GNAT family N-acetyltransferase [Hymenobacter sp. 15J16-1T3B]MCC3157817.1 GNAT family N-acetyltransferase [Hymenobacter sp. 15J16-1T3B]
MLHFQLSPFTELRTPRLLLRRITLADAPTVLFLRSDPATMRYLDREPAASLADAETFVGLVDAGLSENRGITWALARLGEEEQMIGTCGLWRLDAEHHRGEIGYTLHPAAWGQGLMSEALAAVCRYGFEQLRLHSIEGNVNPQNEASIKLLERQGFVREAYFRENYHFRGQFIDSAIYSLLAPRDAT